MTYDIRQCTQCGSFNFEPTPDPCPDCAMANATVRLCSFHGIAGNPCPNPCKPASIRCPLHQEEGSF